MLDFEVRLRMASTKMGIEATDHLVPGIRAANLHDRMGQRRERRTISNPPNLACRLHHILPMDETLAAVGGVSGPQFRPRRETPVDRPRSKPPEHRLAESSESRARVLVVDDDVVFCRTLKRLLGLWGYEPRVALDGPEALEICDAQMPDVAIIGMNGWQLSKKLVRAPIAPAMILVSDTFDSEEVHLDSTVVATLPKPLNEARLRELIEGALAQRGWSAREAQA